MATFNAVSRFATLEAFRRSIFGGLRLAVLVLFVVPASAHTEALSFEQAIDLTAHAPEVRGVKAALESREAGDREITGQTGSPTLTLMPGVRVMSEADRGFEGQVQLTQGWNLAGLAGARRQSAAAERRALSVRLRAAALLQRLEAAQRWIELHALTRGQALVGQELAAAKLHALTISRAVQAGVFSRAALSDAEASTAAVEQKVLGIEAEWVAAQLGLAKATGRTDARRLRIAGAPPEPVLPSLPELRTRFARAERLPEVVAARLEAVAERTREAEAAAQYGTQLQAGVQVEREAPDGLILFGVFSLSFGASNLGARQRSEIRAEAARRESAHREASQEALRQVARVLHEVEHTRQEETVLRKRIVPRLTDLTQQLERTVSAGEATAFALLAAQRRLREAELELVRAEGARRWAEIRAWLLLVAIEAPAGE